MIFLPLETMNEYFYCVSATKAEIVKDVWYMYIYVWRNMFTHVYGKLKKMWSNGSQMNYHFRRKIHYITLQTQKHKHKPNFAFCKDLILRIKPLQKSLDLSKICENFFSQKFLLKIIRYFVVYLELEWAAESGKSPMSCIILLKWYFFMYYDTEILVKIFLLLWLTILQNPIDNL